MLTIFKNLRYVCGLRFALQTRLCHVRKLDMWAHVVRTVAQLDLGVLISIDLFFFPEDCVRELRLEACDLLETGVAHSKEFHDESIVGTGDPYASLATSCDARSPSMITYSPPYLGELPY